LRPPAAAAAPLQQLPGDEERSVPEKRVAEEEEILEWRPVEEGWEGEYSSGLLLLCTGVVCVVVVSSPSSCSWESRDGLCT
jgi:hypothetical protein